MRNQSSSEELTLQSVRAQLNQSTATASHLKIMDEMEPIDREENKQEEPAGVSSEPKSVSPSREMKKLSHPFSSIIRALNLLERNENVAAALNIV